MKYPASMTSFGRGDVSDGTLGWTVEVRSVNHKFCDIRIKIPRQFTSFEERIKKEVANIFSRGHVDVIITPSGQATEVKELHINHSLARQYYECLLQLKKEISLPPSSDDLSLIATFPDVIQSQNKDTDIEQLWPSLQQAVLQSLHTCQDMREREGTNLKSDLLQRVQFVFETIQKIEEKIPMLVEQKKRTLQERVGKLLDNSELNPDRLNQEVALLADKLDITEEIVRIYSHIDQFRHFLDISEPVGRRLDFLLQEFLREINTTASKISDADVAHLTVELKNEVEKMREQVQNLE